MLVFAAIALRLCVCVRARCVCVCGCVCVGVRRDSSTPVCVRARVVCVDVWVLVYVGSCQFTGVRICLKTLLTSMRRRIHACHMTDLAYKCKSEARLITHTHTHTHTQVNRETQTQTKAHTADADADSQATATDIDRHDKRGYIHVFALRAQQGALLFCCSKFSLRFRV